MTAPLRIPSHVFYGAARPQRYRKLRLAEVDQLGLKAEATCRHGNVSQSDGEPDAAHGLGDEVEIPPDQRAKGESGKRQNRVSQDAPAVVAAQDDGEVPEGRKVHAHEGQERAEVQKFSGMRVGVADVIQRNSTDKG